MYINFHLLKNVKIYVEVFDIYWAFIKHNEK